MPARKASISTRTASHSAGASGLAAAISRLWLIRQGLRIHNSHPSNAMFDAAADALGEAYGNT